LKGEFGRVKSFLGVYGNERRVLPISTCTFVPHHDMLLNLLIFLDAWVG